MNENLYIAHKNLPHKTLCVHSARYTVHTCKLSQAKTTKGHALIPTYPFPKVELCITVKCKNIYLNSYRLAALLIEIPPYQS